MGYFKILIEVPARLTEPAADARRIGELHPDIKRDIANRVAADADGVSKGFPPPFGECFAFAVQVGAVGIGRAGEDHRAADGRGGGDWRGVRLGRPGQAGGCRDG